MRNVIDVNVATNEVEFVSNTNDGACESCINFIVDHDISVVLTKDGVEQEYIVPALDGVACFMLDDSILRCAGEFTVATAGVTPLAFVVLNDVATDESFSIRYVDNVFRICTRNASKAEDYVLEQFPLYEGTVSPGETIVLNADIRKFPLLATRINYQSALSFRAPIANNVTFSAAQGNTQTGINLFVAQLTEIPLSGSMAGRNATLSYAMYMTANADGNNSAYKQTVMRDLYGYRVVPNPDK